MLKNFTTRSDNSDLYHYWVVTLCAVLNIAHLLILKVNLRNEHLKPEFTQVLSGGAKTHVQVWPSLTFYPFPLGKHMEWHQNSGEAIFSTKHGSISWFTSVTTAYINSWWKFTMKTHCLPSCGLHFCQKHRYINQQWALTEVWKGSKRTEEGWLILLRGKKEAQGRTNMQSVKHQGSLRGQQTIQCPHGKGGRGRRDRCTGGSRQRGVHPLFWPYCFLQRELQTRIKAAWRSLKSTRGKHWKWGEYMQNHQIKMLKPRGVSIPNTQYSFH